MLGCFREEEVLHGRMKLCGRNDKMNPRQRVRHLNVCLDMMFSKSPKQDWDLSKPFVPVLTVCIRGLVSDIYKTHNEPVPFVGTQDCGALHILSVIRVFSVIYCWGGVWGCACRRAGPIESRCVKVSDWWTNRAGHIDSSTSTFCWWFWVFISVLSFSGSVWSTPSNSQRSGFGWKGVL